jgi:hypothetical protein
LGIWEPRPRRARIRIKRVVDRHRKSIRKLSKPAAKPRRRPSAR